MQHSNLIRKFAASVFPETTETVRRCIVKGCKVNNYSLTNYMTVLKFPKEPNLKNKLSLLYPEKIVLFVHFIVKKIILSDTTNFQHEDGKIGMNLSNHTK